MAKAAGKSVNSNTDVLSNTSPRDIDTVKTWMQVFDILQHELINYPEDLGDEATETHAMKLKDITQSDLHKIVAWPRILPYKDMIG
jgi:hypothetical protein